MVVKYMKEQKCSDGENFEFFLDSNKGFSKAVFKHPLGTPLSDEDEFSYEWYESIHEVDEHADEMAICKSALKASKNIVKTS